MCRTRIPSGFDACSTTYNQNVEPWWRAYLNWVWDRPTDRSRRLPVTALTSTHGVGRLLLPFSKRLHPCGCLLQLHRHTYAGREVLSEVVYAYGLKEAIDKGFLKKVDIQGYSNTRNDEFIEIAIEAFLKETVSLRSEGMLPKLVNEVLQISLPEPLCPSSFNGKNRQA